MANPIFTRLFSSTGASDTITDIDYNDGWETIAGANPPTKEQFNAIDGEQDIKLTYLDKRSRQLWQSDIDYLIYEIALGTDGKLYKALSNNTNFEPSANPTKWGNLVPDTFAGGTKMLFAQASAPSGWTQDVTDTANNRMLRVVNGAGAGTGGSSSPIASHTHSTASHQLTIAEIPSHGHAISPTIRIGNGTDGTAGAVSGANPSTIITASDTGGDGSHGHGDTGASFTPRYLNIILCSKN